MTRRAPRRATLAWTNSPLRVKGLVVVAIPLIAILVSAFSYLRIERQDQAAEALVEHSQRISADIGRAVNILLDAENGVRGYLLSGNVGDLKSFGTAQRTLPDAMVDLYHLVQDTQVQTDRMSRITSLAEQELDNLAVLSSLPPGTTSKNEKALLVNSDNLAQALRSEFDAMRSDEDRLLADRTRRAWKGNCSGRPSEHGQVRAFWPSPRFFSVSSTSATWRGATRTSSTS